jgi:site-specific DNA-methyltransferase (adenine-specific)
MMQGTIGNGRRVQGNKKLNEKRIHPTQKPVHLYNWVYSKFTKKGDKILDTHMGSQSSRIAARSWDLNYWGLDNDREIFDLGCKRFALYEQQIRIDL